MVTYSWERWKEGGMGFFCGNENILKWIMVMDAELCTQSHWTIHSKWMNCVACELCLNEAGFKEKNIQNQVFYVFK